MLSEVPRCEVPKSESSSSRQSEIPVRAVDDTDDGAALSSPNSAVSSFQMDFCFRNSRKSCEGASDEDDENGSTRKKLRLSKQQSVFLEESFKEHTTLNPVILTFLFSLFHFNTQSLLEDIVIVD